MTNSSIHAYETCMWLGPIMRLNGCLESSIVADPVSLCLYEANESKDEC